MGVGMGVGMGMARGSARELKKHKDREILRVMGEGLGLEGVHKVCEIG